MADPTFALHLGDGVYIDAEGNITHGAPPAPVIYEAEFKLPIDPKKTADALKSVAEALKDVDKSKKVVDDINKIYGFLVGGDGDNVNATALLTVLSAVGKIAGTVAPVFLVASFALDVANMLKLFNTGQTELETFSNRLFETLRVRFEVIGDLIRTSGLIEGRNAITAMRADATEYVAKLPNPPFSIEQLAAKHIKLTGAFNTSRPAIQKLLNPTFWRTPFDPDKHSQIWGLMQHHLFFLPRGRGEAPVRARVPTLSNQFDHRLMVPLALHAGAAFLAGLRALAPEYRTTGDSRPMLQDFATKIDQLAQSMREEVLARTIYTAADFGVLLFPNEVIEDDFPNPVAMAPRGARFPVGALDLRYHDNLFFEPFIAQLSRAHVYGWQIDTRRACMDFGWTPPATLAVSHDHNGKRDGYRITNPEQCAAAANAQSELDYAELLSLSGYTQLVQLATLFRHESTDPDRSQTVQIEPPQLDRRAEPGAKVTIESDLGPRMGKITSDAVRAAQRCKAEVPVSTQPVQRVEPVEYVVRLRTLRSLWNTTRWREPVYSAFQYVHYVPDPADPRFLQMVIDERLETVLDSEPLIKGHSPADGARSAEGTAKLRADTFDWWIPVKPPYSIGVSFERTERSLRGLGYATTTLDTSAPRLANASGPMPDPGARFAQASDTVYQPGAPVLSFLDGTQNWEGEHRDAREVEVTVKWRLDWDGDRMLVSLEGDPVDRNYVVYVVIEEKLQFTGKVLHTATPIPMNGQLTYVPQAFFDAENEAIKKAARTASEFNRRYALSTEVSPDDPIVGWLRPGDLALPTSLEKVLALAQQHQPNLLRAAIASAAGDPVPADYQGQERAWVIQGGATRPPSRAH